MMNLPAKGGLLKLTNNRAPGAFTKARNSVTDEQEILIRKIKEKEEKK